jgi:hypothetical protein
MLFQKTDNVFTIPLPKSDLIFTRYLYVKDEVRVAILSSILKKSDDAIFWAYELYYSGFKHELFELLWNIYYDFFATLNPSFESYFLKKHGEWIDNEYDTLVSSIVQSLLFRPFNTDVFMLRNICESFEINCNYIKNDAKQNLELWIKEKDYRSVAQWILNENTTIDVINIYIMCLHIFHANGLKISINRLKNEFIRITKINTNIKHILLTKTMTLFSMEEKLKKGKIMYIAVVPDDIIQYDTVHGNRELKAYNILKHECICGINDTNHLSLFKLTRAKYAVKDAYFNNWEYHASFTPLWSQRIQWYGGYPDYNSQKIIFTEDESAEKFYRLYGYEPDEQKLEVQEKSVGSIKKVYNWKWFYDTYKKNGLFDVYEEELEEFDVDGLKY